MLGSFSVLKVTPCFHRKRALNSKFQTTLSTYKPRTRQNKLLIICQCLEKVEAGDAFKPVNKKHHPARVTNAEITSCKNLKQLRKILVSKQHELDFINVSAAFNQLPQTALKKDGQQELVEEVVTFLVEFYLDQSSQFGPQQMSNMVQGLGKIKWRPNKEWQMQVQLQIEQDISHFKRLECARVLHGLTYLKGIRTSNSSISPLIPEWQTTVSLLLNQYFGQTVDPLEPSTTAQILWSLGKLRFLPSYQQYIELISQLDDEIGRIQERDWCIALQGIALLKNVFDNYQNQFSSQNLQSDFSLNQLEQNQQSDQENKLQIPKEQYGSQDQIFQQSQPMYNAQDEIQYQSFSFDQQNSSNQFNVENVNNNLQQIDQNFQSQPINNEYSLQEDPSLNQDLNNLQQSQESQQLQLDINQQQITDQIMPENSNEYLQETQNSFLQGQSSQSLEESQQKFFQDQPSQNFQYNLQQDDNNMESNVFEGQLYQELQQQQQYIQQDQQSQENEYLELQQQQYKIFDQTQQNQYNFPYEQQQQHQQSSNQPQQDQESPTRQQQQQQQSDQIQQNLQNFPNEQQQQHQQSLNQPQQDQQSQTIGDYQQKFQNQQQQQNKQQRDQVQQTLQNQANEKRQQLVYRIFRHLATGIRLRPQNYNPKRLAIITWSMATLEMGDGPLLHQIVQYSIPQRHDFKFLDIQQLLWGTSFLIKNEYVLSNHLIVRMFVVMGEEVKKKVCEFQSQGLSNVFLAYARMQLGDEELFLLLNQQIGKKMRDFKLVELCALLWAYGEVWSYDYKSHNESLMLKLIKRIKLSKESFGPAEISSIAKALAKLQHYDQDLLHKLKYYILQNVRKLSLVDCVAIFHSFVYLDYRDPDVMQIFLYRMNNLADSEQWNAWCVGNALWCLAILDMQDTPFFTKLLQLINQIEIFQFKIQTLSQIYESYMITYGDQWSQVSQQIMLASERAWKERIRKQKQIPISTMQKQMQTSILGMFLPNVQCCETIADVRFPADIAVRIGDRQIVMLVGGGYMYTRKPPFRELAPATAKRKVLSALGWECLIIPFYEWYDLRGKEQHEEYMKNKLFDSLNQGPISDMWNT